MQETPNTLLFFWERPTLGQILKIKSRLTNESFFCATSGVSQNEINQLLQKKISHYPKQDDWRNEEDNARTDYLKICSQIPHLRYQGRKIIEDLKWRGANLYWFLGHAEKSLWISRLPHQIFAYQKMRSIHGDQLIEKIILVSNDSAFNKLIRREFGNNKIEIISEKTPQKTLFIELLKTFIKEFYKLTYKKYFLKKLHLNDRKSVDQNEFALFSQFPDWWKIDNGRVNEIFFKDIFNYENNNITAILRINFWKDFPKQAPQFIDFLKKKNTIILENYNSWADFYKILKTLPKIYYYLLNAKKGLQEEQGLLGKYSEIISKDLEKGATSGILPWTQLTFLAFKKINLDQFKNIYYRLEFHAHEAALNFASKRTKNIGLQHSAIGKNFFNYHFEENEFHTNNIPIPQQFLVTGLRVRELFLKAGANENQIKVIGALRLRNLYNKQKVTSTDKIFSRPLYVFMPLSQMLNEVLEMFSTLLLCGPLLKGPVRLLIKLNPNKTNDSSYLEEVQYQIGQLKDLFECDIIPQNQAAETCYKKSHLLFVTGGTTPFEAMTFGVPSVVFSQSFSLTHNPIEEYPEGALIVKDEFDLAQALNKSLDKDELDTMERSWPMILEQIMGNMETDPKNLFWD